MFLDLYLLILWIWIIYLKKKFFLSENILGIFFGHHKQAKDTYIPPNLFSINFNFFFQILWDVGGPYGGNGRSSIPTLSQNLGFLGQLVSEPLSLFQFFHLIGRTFDFSITLAQNRGQIRIPRGFSGLMPKKFFKSDENWIFYNFFSKKLGVLKLARGGKLERTSPS